MATNSNNLLNLIYETKAVSIWNSATGPVFWYAASVPGPFYVNTELLIGPETAQELLDKITAIIAATQDSAARAQQLNDLILKAYHAHPSYRQVMSALAAVTKEGFPSSSFDMISGGERRDWLFSIPLAFELNVRHLYLFKNGQFYCPQSIQPGQRALHVADLINNAASYFDSWFPILAKAQITCVGTVCVNTRGNAGLKKLEEFGQKVLALHKIDSAFFRSLHENGLISQKTVDEIAIYFESPAAWAERYLLESPELFDIPHIDKKSFERLQTFFAKDPWQLRSKHQALFSRIDHAIAQRSQG